MADAPTTLLTEWLRRQLPGAGFAWLAAQLDRLSGSDADRDLHVTLGMIPRRLGKADLALTADDLAAADAARPGWDPRQWTVDEAARVLALLRVAADDDHFAARFTELCRSADVAEAVALYRGLPLYPGPARLEAQAAEGLRTHMRAVFEAVAHRSPFPRERFGEDRWNQMVLKALFVGSPLHPIQGLDERANPVLARILGDYAHERWAAGRPVSPELWRCVGPFADGPLLDDLERAAGGQSPERAAAALALAASPAPRARALLDRLLPEEAASLRDGRLSWETLARAL